MSILMTEEGEPWFPHPEMAPSHGYLAAGGDLTPQRLVLAYSNGIFPWEASGEPRLWRWFLGSRFLLFLMSLNRIAILGFSIRRSSKSVSTRTMKQ